MTSCWCPSKKLARWSALKDWCEKELRNRKRALIFIWTRVHDHLRMQNANFGLGFTSLKVSVIQVSRTNSVFCVPKCSCQDTDVYIINGSFLGLGFEFPNFIGPTPNSSPFRSAPSRCCLVFSIIQTHYTGWIEHDKTLWNMYGSMLYELNHQMVCDFGAPVCVHAMRLSHFFVCLLHAL